MDRALLLSFGIRSSASDGQIFTSCCSSSVLCPFAAAGSQPTFPGPSPIDDLYHQRDVRELRMKPSESAVFTGSEPPYITVEADKSLTGHSFDDRVSASVSASLPNLAHFTLLENSSGFNIRVSRRSCLASLDAPALKDPQPIINSYSKMSNRHECELTDALSLSVGDDNFCLSPGKSDCSLSCPFQLSYVDNSLHSESHPVSNGRGVLCEKTFPVSCQDSLVDHQAYSAADKDGTDSSNSDSLNRHYQQCFHGSASESEDDLLPRSRRRRSGLSDGSAGSSDESDCNELIHSDRSCTAVDRYECTEVSTTCVVARRTRASPFPDSSLVSELSLEVPQDQEIEKESNVTENDVDLDADKDILNPAYVPRTGAYFMHDYRASENTDDTEHSTVVKSRADCGRWSHDLFHYQDQGPRSDLEIIRRYGRDIRKDDTDSIGDSSTTSKFVLPDQAHNQFLTANRGTPADGMQDAPTGTASISRPPRGFTSHTRPGRFTRSSLFRRVQVDSCISSDFNTNPENAATFRTYHPSLAAKSSPPPVQRFLQTGFGNQLATNSVVQQRSPHETDDFTHRSFRLPASPKDDLLDHRGRQESIVNQRHYSIDMRKETNQGDCIPKRYSTLRQKSLILALPEVRNDKRSSFCERNNTGFPAQNLQSTVHGQILNNCADSPQTLYTRSSPEHRNQTTSVFPVPSNGDHVSRNLRHGPTRSYAANSDSRRVFCDPISLRPFETTNPKLSGFQQPFDAYDGQLTICNRSRSGFTRPAEYGYSKTRAFDRMPFVRSCDQDSNRNTFSRYPENRARRGLANGYRTVLGRKPFATQEIRGARGQSTRSILVE